MLTHPHLSQRDDTFLALTEEQVVQLPLTDLLERLRTSPDGISQAERKQCLLQAGYNELPEKEERLVDKLFSHFWEPIPWMIEVAAVLSALVRDWTDFGIILTLLIVNALIGFWEEYQAGNAIAFTLSAILLSLIYVSQTSQSVIIVLLAFAIVSVITEVALQKTVKRPIAPRVSTSCCKPLALQPPIDANTESTFLPLRGLQG